MLYGRLRRFIRTRQVPQPEPVALFVGSKRPMLEDTLTCPKCRVAWPMVALTFQNGKALCPRDRSALRG